MNLPSHHSEKLFRNFDLHVFVKAETCAAIFQNENAQKDVGKDPCISAPKKHADNSPSYDNYPDHRHVIQV